MHGALSGIRSGRWASKLAKAGMPARQVGTSLCKIQLSPATNRVMSHEDTLLALLERHRDALHRIAYAHAGTEMGV